MEHDRVTATQAPWQFREALLELAHRHDVRSLQPNRSPDRYDLQALVTKSVVGMCLPTRRTPGMADLVGATLWTSQTGMSVPRSPKSTLAPVART